MLKRGPDLCLLFLPSFSHPRPPSKSTVTPPSLIFCKEGDFIAVAQWFRSLVHVDLFPFTYLRNRPERNSFSKFDLDSV